LRKLIAAAALALISTSVHAEVHNIQFGEHAFRVEIPRDCQDLSCIRLSTSEKSTAKPRKRSEPATAPAAPANAAPAAVSRERVKAATPQPTAAPAYAAPRNDPPAETQIEREPILGGNIAERPPVAPSLPAKPVVEARQPDVTVFEPKPEGARSEVSGPIGLWLTEKGDGRIRIEPCGQALCGFVDGRPSEKVLINMKPTQSNRWSGKINDIRGGGTYMANITLKGANSLRVEGCAFGGMFCGGETWTRVH